MGATGEIIAASARRTQQYAERLLNAVTYEKFARKPVFEQGAKVVDTNHPCFVYGHLALYPGKVVQMIGVSARDAEVPTNWDELFRAGAECQDDPDRKIYPDMKVVTEKFFAGYKAAIEAVAQLPDAKFSEQTPNERYREFFPTIGGLCNFLLNNHVSMHLGQVSVWRRCYGLAPV